ncbi:MAG: hypothetical protein H0X36_13565, partial [Sphingomonadaceae bacterium]|nr:hypothetical protein [Sphingomonadaceae bacterium]
MPFAAPLLPVLAMMSSEAQAMAATGAPDAAREQKLQALVDQLPPAPPADAPPPALLTEDGALSADDALIDGRRRPGHQKGLPERVTQDNPGAVRAPPPEAFPTDEFPVPDRWRLVKTLCPDTGKFPGIANVCHSTRDPYHQNVLKGDRPLCIATEKEQARRRAAGMPRCATPGFLHGGDWFFVTNLTSDTVIEPRSFPTPVGVQTTERPGSLDVFGRAQSLLLAQTFIAGFSLIKGSTAYKPPEIEYTLSLAYQTNYVDVSERRILSVKPSASSHRYDNFLGVQEAFIDYHIRNTSDRYDFDSIRVGIQPFQADFRG